MSCAIPAYGNARTAADAAAMIQIRMIRSFRRYAPGVIFLATVRPSTRNTTKIARKMKNRAFAMPAAPAAISVKPNRAAMIEITKKITAHRSIGHLRLRLARKPARFPRLLPAHRVHCHPRQFVVPPIAGGRAPCRRPFGCPAPRYPPLLLLLALERRPRYPDFAR